MRKHPLLQLAIDNANTSKPLRAETAGNEATIYLHGVIGSFWGDIDETEFSKTLANIDAKVIHLRINSPGGDVFAGRVMMTAIAQHPARVIGHVDGLAASAASGICMACDEVEIAQGAEIMVHEGWTVTIGNKRDHRKTGDLLEKIDSGLVDDYARRSGKDAASITAMMEAETWLTADESVAAGFADRKVDVVARRSNSTWNLSAYKNAPKDLADHQVDDPQQMAAHVNHLSRQLRLLTNLSA